MIWTLCLLLSASLWATNFRISKAPEVITSLKSNDAIFASAKVIGDTASHIRGENHTLLDTQNNRLIVFGMEHTIFAVDLATGKTTTIIKTPVMAGGAQFDPRDSRKVLFCGTKEEGSVYPENVKNGVYELDMSFTPAKLKLVIGRAFKDVVPVSGEGKVYPINNAPKMDLWDLNKKSAVTRDFGICDDVAVSADGERVYITEPYSTEGGGFGDELSSRVNQREMLMATQNGKLWMFDRRNNSLNLIATQFAYVNGIAIENLNPAKKEESMLVTEMARYKLHRFNLKVGGFDTLFSNMPGMPNSLAIDENGNVYLAMNKMRSKMLDTLINSSPRVKELALKLPSSIKPIPRETGLIIFRAEGRKLLPIYFSVHDGSQLKNVVSWSPNLETREIYLSLFDPMYPGIFKISMPEVVK